MNFLFPIVFLICAVLLLFFAPQNFLASLLDGASVGASLCIALLASYAVWLGLMRVWEECGVSKKVANLFRPLVKRLFRVNDEKAVDAISMNLSVNLLGISGAGTPYGITAAKLLDKTDNAEFSSAMLFVLNATSIQLIPTSMIGFRTALGSATPADIFLPTLIATAFSTLFAVGLLYIHFLEKPKIFIPKRAKQGGQV